MGGLMRKVWATAVFAGVVAGTPNVMAQDSATAAGDEDRRIPVVLRPVEKTRVLSDMRQYLKGLQEMFTALAKEDMETVALKAKEMGRINIYDTVIISQGRAGTKFRELSSLVHEDFEQIAYNALTSKNPKATLQELALTMKHCVSCHESYRLADYAHSR